MLDEKTLGDLNVHHLAGKCNWTLRMSGNGSSDVVPLTADYTDVLIQRVCQETGCGGVYSVAKSRSARSATCFHSCSYRDHRLQNCSQSVRSDCIVINAAVCGNRAVRLSGGSDRCAGRVELWRDGRWGTVCDDHWDLRDAAVVCGQLGCGFALSVTGQGGAFPPGRGPVYRDDLNCSGREENLWACPAAQDEPDCGHKEDAGVVCSEMRSVRLSGGLDRCSGKVEIHRNGSWGTICDNCWNFHMAVLVCSMLQCGPEPLRFSQFLPPLTHSNETLYYYDCVPGDRSLWQCLEFINPTFLCTSSKAAGVVCNGSLGLRPAPTPPTGGTTSWTTERSTLSPAAEEAFLQFPELLVTVSVSLLLLLLVLLVTNTVLCCHYRRRHAFLLQQTRFSGKSSDSGSHQNYYKEPVNLVGVRSSSHEADGPAKPRFLWSQISSADSASVDTDYEQFDPSTDPAVSLSTFRNSQRYRTDVHPLLRPPALHCLTEDGGESLNKGTPASGRHDGGGGAPQQARESLISVDSFQSSSTSSEECYENVANGYVAVTPDPGPGWSSQSQSEENLQSDGSAELQSSDDEDEDHLYSPVSPD